MKTSIMRLGLGALMAVSAYAQTLRMTVEIPFPFQVGTISFAAGRYEVAKLPAQPAWLIQRPLQTGHIFLVSSGVVPDTVPEKSRLTFHRYGNAYFLAELWAAGTELGWRLSPSGHERELAKVVPLVETASVEARKP